MRVVVGLGNPGKRYEKTRHNVGFRFLDRLAKDLSAGPETRGDKYRVRWAEIEGERVALIWPLTYMNESGLALERFHGQVAAQARDHLVVLDDASLPFGAIRMRGRGSAGGHRGLLSVLEHLGTEEVPRLRLGVGDSVEGLDLADFVLDPFGPEEEEALEPWLARAGEAARVYFTEGLEAAMNRYNR